MFRPFSRARATAFLALIGVLLSPAAFAADMPDPMPMPTPVNEGPMEWGTGWYLRGDIGAAHVTPEDLNGVLLSRDFANNLTVGIGGGYRYNDWVRTDVTLDYATLFEKNGPQNTVLPCQVGAIGTPIGGPFTGSIPVFSACTPVVRNRTESAVALANVYFDLGNWWGFTPYVGAGAGLNVLFQRAQTTWFTSNLVPYAGTTWIDPFSGVTYMANWDRNVSGTFMRFSYAFMGGVAYDLTEHIKIDVGYRWLNLGRIEGVDSFNNRVSKDLISQQVRLGFRYMID